MPRKKVAYKNAPNNTTTTSTANKRPTAQEMREWYDKNQKNHLNFDKANEALLSLRDVSKNTVYTTIGNFNKENLREYLQNVTNNEINLRIDLFLIMQICFACMREA